MNPYILTKESSLKRTVWPCGFGCPLCPKFTTKSDSVIQRHLENHSANAVHFQEKIICRCNLYCRHGGHFHCPFCDATLIRKEDITLHLTECHKKYDVVQPTSSRETPPTLKDLQEDCAASPPVSVEHSYSHPAVFVSTTDHTYALRPSSKTPTDSVQSPPATTHNTNSSSEKVTVDSVQSPPATTHQTIAPRKKALWILFSRPQLQPTPP